MRLITATDQGRKIVSDRLKDVPAEKRIRAYMANPELTTYGSGKYTGLMMLQHHQAGIFP